MRLHESGTKVGGASAKLPQLRSANVEDLVRRRLLTGWELRKKFSAEDGGKNRSALNLAGLIRSRKVGWRIVWGTARTPLPQAPVRFAHTPYDFAPPVTRAAGSLR